MEGLTGTPKDSKRSSDEELQPSSSTEDRLQLAQEQLAELQLLTCADPNSPAPSIASPMNEAAESPLAFKEEGDSQVDEGEPRDKSQVATRALSSFSAVLAASRKISMTSDPPAVPSSDFDSENGVRVAPLDQSEATMRNNLRSPKTPGNTLPTLDEEAEGHEDADNGKIPKTIPHAINTSFVDKLSSSRSSIEMAPVRQEQELEERDSDDLELIEMLKHLSRGQFDSLALTPDDVTVHKLKRVHAALSKAQSSTTNMPYVRALVSIDMLQLLLRRVGVQKVRDAVSRAMLSTNERDESIEPIALLTSSNIAAIVLKARRELSPATPSEVSPQIPRRASLVTGKKQLHRSPRASPRSYSSPASPVSSSSQCGTPRSPVAHRRSILAKEGIHVLMQEKIMFFDQRGRANTLPAFRVRGASATLSDSAAKRRQRGLQYANEHISHRSVHL